MTRLYIQPSFLNSCEEHGLWSGGNDQYRGDRSVDLATFDKNGRARVEAFSDAAIESLKKRKTSVPLADRILPQAKRVRLLREQLYELEAERKSGMDIHTYSQLRDILMQKLHRAEELLKKAITPVQKAEETDEDSGISTPFSHVNAQPSDGYASEEYDEIGVEFIDQLSNGNSLKGLLKFSCKAIRGLVRFSSATKRYIKTLQEV